MEARVLPANRRSRRQPPGRTRDSIPLSENHTPIPSPDSGAGPLCERRRPEPRSCGPLLRRRTRSLRRSDRPLLRYAGLARDTCRRWRSPQGNAVARAGDSARPDPTRGIAITPADGRARVLAVETNRPVEAILAAQLKPDGSRSRLLRRRSRAKHGRGRAQARSPADGRHSPRSAPAASPPNEAVASSPRAPRDEAIER